MVVARAHSTHTHSYIHMHSPPPHVTRTPHHQCAGSNTRKATARKKAWQSEQAGTGREAGPFDCLDDDWAHTYLPCRSGEVFKVSKLECWIILTVVLMPIFAFSPQLLSLKVEQQQQSCSRQHETDAERKARHVAAVQPALSDGAHAQPSSATPWKEHKLWIDQPCCVARAAATNLASTSRQEDLQTQCVLLPNRIPSTSGTLPGHRRSHLVPVTRGTAPSRHREVTFTLHAAKLSLTNDGNTWNEAQEQAHRVRYYIPRLLFNLRHPQSLEYWKIVMRPPPAAAAEEGQERLRHDQVAFEEVIHMCETEGCCCPWHLKWGTKSENQRRSLRHKKQRGKNKKYSWREIKEEEQE